MNDQEARQIRQADRFNAFVAVRPDPVASGGPLAGARIAVKDNIAVAGMAYTAGHPLFAARIAEGDAEVVRRLRAAGGRVVGVTQTDAGGFGVTTPTVINPLAPELTAGGSSGGSAVAVAAHLAELGLGTDTGGSVRIPAACCGLFGFKPTWTQALLEGVWPLAPEFDHVGLMTNDIDLLRTAAAAVLLREADAAGSIKTIGVDVAHFAPASLKTKSALAAVIASIKRAGWHIEPVVLPDRAPVTKAHSVLVLSSALANYANKLTAAQIERLAPTAQKSLAAARRIARSDIDAAKLAAARACAQLDRVFAETDLVLLPTLLVEPPPRDAHRVVLDGNGVPIVAALVAEACLANLAGCPAIALPVGGKDPIPASVQLMAPRGADFRLLDFVRELIALL